MDIEKNKHRENPGIESASGSLRAAGLKCIRSRNRVSLRLPSGNEGSSNYRGIQPIVTRFPPEDCARLSEADRMWKKKQWEKDREERKGEIKKTISRGEKRGAKEARFRQLPATETPRNRRRQGGEGERDREKRKRNKRKAKREMQIKRLLSSEHKL